MSVFCSGFNFNVGAGNLDILELTVIELSLKGGGGILVGRYVHVQARSFIPLFHTG